MFNCDHCNRSFSNPGGLGSHKPYCKDNPNRKKRKRSPSAGAKKGSIPWNKGTKTSDDVKLKISKSLIGKSKGVASTKEKEIERREKISETMKQNPNAGGLRKGSGRGIKGRYQNIWCDSTWELAWVIYQFDHNVNFSRNTQGFDYIFNKKTLKYYPDFKVGNTYIEIKGRRNYESMSDKNKQKLDSFNGDIQILFESDMKPILDYVINKYGKDFHTLYE